MTLLVSIPQRAANYNQIIKMYDIQSTPDRVIGPRPLSSRVMNLREGKPQLGKVKVLAEQWIEGPKSIFVAYSASLLNVFSFSVASSLNR
jgi:hypothetical protein